MARIKPDAKTLNDLRALAKALHAAQCNYSHIDQCGWEYEAEGIPPGTSKSNPWTGDTHKHWLRKAEKLTGYLAHEGITPGQAVTVLKILKLRE